MDVQARLSRRERQVMDIIYAHGSATATDVLAELTDPPSRTAVRTFLRILEDKGFLRHRMKGREFVFVPVHARGKAARFALRRVLQTFFEGSLQKAVAAHFDDPRSQISDQELEHLRELIDQAQKRGN